MMSFPLDMMMALWHNFLILRMLKHYYIIREERFTCRVWKYERSNPNFTTCVYENTQKVSRRFEKEHYENC